MNSIELTDVDGDALTLITREDGLWVTCTSGPEEVTVGPFPTELLRGVISKGLDDPAAALGDFVVLGEQRI